MASEGNFKSPWLTKSQSILVWIVVLVVLCLSIYFYSSIKQADFDSEYSKYCTNHLVYGFWENFSWVQFTNKHFKIDGKYYFQWTYNTDDVFSNFHCYLSNKDDVYIYLSPDNLHHYSDLESYNSRKLACEDSVKYYFNYDWYFSWEDEVEEDNYHQLSWDFYYKMSWDDNGLAVDCLVYPNLDYVSVNFDRTNEVFNISY